MKAKGTVIPPNRKIDIADAIANLGDAFAGAVAGVPGALVETDYRIAGYPVRLRIAGGGLAADIDRSLGHLRATGAAYPALTIEIWDDEEAGPAGWTDWPEDVDFYGTISVADDARFVLNQRQSSVMLLDRRENRITGCVRGRASLFLDERARPFHRLLSIWLDDRDIQFIHAALSVVEGHGLLFVGRGGSGKSTSSIACFLAGFPFLSDDFVALEKAEEGRLVGHSLYATCLIASDHIGRFASLSRIAHPANHDIELKSVVYLADHQAARFATDTRIAAVILPKVVDRPKSTYSRAKPMEAMLALAPTSIIILPGAAPSALDKLSELVTSVPAFWLELGHDVARIVPTVRQICEELAGNG